MADDLERAFRLTIEVFPSLAFFIPDKLAWDVEAILAEHEAKIRATVLEILKDACSATLAESAVLLFDSVMDLGTELLRAALDRAAWVDDNNPPEVYDGTADALYQDALDFAKQRYESVASEIPGFGSEIRPDLVATMRKEWLRIREEAKQDVHEWSQKIREQNAERDHEPISDGTAQGDLPRRRMETVAEASNVELVGAPVSSVEGAAGEAAESQPSAAASKTQADRPAIVLGTAGQPTGKPTVGVFATDPKIRKLVEEHPEVLPHVSLVAHIERARAEAEVAFRQRELTEQWGLWSGVHPWDDEPNLETTDCPWWVAGAEYVFRVVADWRAHFPATPERREALLSEQVKLTANWVYWNRVFVHDGVHSKSPKPEDLLGHGNAERFSNFAFLFALQRFAEKDLGEWRDRAALLAEAVADLPVGIAAQSVSPAADGSDRPTPVKEEVRATGADSKPPEEPEPSDVLTNDRTAGPISVRWPAKGSTDRPSQTDPIWTIRATQKDPIPVTRLNGKVDWISPSKANEPDDAVLTPEDERRIAEVTLAGRSELRSEVEAAFGGPAWPQAGAIVEPFRRYAVKVFDVNATAFRNASPTQGGDSDEVLGAMASNLLVEVFGREWEGSPGEQVIRTDWQQGTEGWKGREFIVIAGNDPDPTCLYHQVIGDAIKYRYRFHDVLPPPIPGEPPGINLSNLEWWQYIGLNERHNLAMAIKPYLDDRVEYWQHQLIHEASAPSESEGASGAAKSTASDQSTQPESGATSVRTPTTAGVSSSNAVLAMESPTRIRFEAGVALAEVTLNQDVKDHGPSLEVARKYVTSATLTLARCILTPDCAEPYEAIRRAYDFAEWFAAETMKTAWVWLCVFSEMNTSGKLEKYKREGRTENGAPKGMSDAEIREWHSCLYGVAHLALDEFVPEFWKERLQYFSSAAESLKAASPPTSEDDAVTGTGQSAGEMQGPAPEIAGASRAAGDAARQDTKPRPGKERKGDASLLAGKRAVNFRTAEQYLGLTERQRQNLVKDQVLVVEGKGQNKKITSDSLRAYLPPENPN